MAQVGKSFGIHLSGMWSEFEKAASPHPRALAAAVVALSSLAYLSSKSKFFFRWPVTIATVSCSMLLVGLLFRAIQATPLVPGSSDKREENSKIIASFAILANLALQRMKVKPEISFPIDEEPRMAEQLLEEALFSELAKEALSENIDSGKEPMEHEDQTVISLPKPNLSDEQEVLSENDPLLEALTQEICVELSLGLCAAQTAVACCRVIPNPRWDRKVFSDKVKQAFLNAEKIRVLLIQKNLPCSLEGIFIIANMLTEEEEASLCRGLELSETFHREVEGVVSDWNLLEPLRREGYFLEEVFFASVTKLSYDQAKETIDTTRKISALLRQYGHEDYSFKNVFPFADAIRVRFIQPFDVWGILNPLIKDKYALGEIYLALDWIQGPSLDKLNFKPPTCSQVKEAIDTARKVCVLMKKYGHEDRPFKEIFLTANTMKMQTGRMFDLFLDTFPEMFCHFLMGGIKQKANIEKVTAVLTQKGYKQYEIAPAAAWVNANASSNLGANGEPNLESIESLFAIDPSELEAIIETARQFSALLKKNSKTSYKFEEILFASNDLRVERKQSLEDLLKEDSKSLCKAIDEKISAAKSSEGDFLGALSGFLPRF